MEESHYQLYRKFLNNSCSSEELTSLFHLFGTTDEDSLREMISEELLTDEADLPAAPKEAERLQAIRSVVMKEVGRRKIKVLIYRISAAAAIVIAVASAFLLKLKNESIPEPAKTPVLMVVKHGALQATLTLANGKKIVIGRSMNGTLARLGQTTVNINPANGVSFQSKQSENSSLISNNTLATGRGEQSPYPLILTDGSKVWLNAASSITFPTQFNGKDRIVTITGEAYFEVAHDQAHPFKVISGRQEVTVFGTHFNIKAYSDDEHISTTLLQGSVKVEDLSSGISDFLTPGQQSKLDRTSGQLHIGSANLEEVIAWKNGFFMFNGQKISSVMKSMSRWYDVEVEYRNFNNNNEKFGGTFSRTTNLEDILTSLQSLGKARFKIEKRKIIVSN